MTKTDAGHAVRRQNHIIVIIIIITVAVSRPVSSELLDRTVSQVLRSSRLCTGPTAAGAGHRLAAGHVVTHQATRHSTHLPVRLIVSQRNASNATFLLRTFVITQLTQNSAQAWKDLGCGLKACMVFVQHNARKQTTQI